MRSNTRRQLAPRLRIAPAQARLLAIVATLCSLALVIGACSLTSAPSTSSDNGGVSSNTGSVTTGGGQTTPVKILRGGGGAAMILVPITIDGQGPYNFALDTGAGITLIDTDLAHHLDLQVTGDSIQVAGVGGTQNIIPVHIDSWSAGKIMLPSVDIAETGLASFKANSDVRGLLGSDILSRFGRITINYDTGELSVANAASSQAATSRQEPLAAFLRAALRP